MEMVKILIISCFIIMPLAIHRLKGDIMESSVKTANIYYQQPLKNGKRHELNLGSIEELISKTDIKVIVHGYLGSRFHNSIIPLRNGECPSHHCCKIFNRHQFIEVKSFELKSLYYVSGYKINATYFVAAYMAQGKENVYFADWENAASFDYAASRELVAKVGVFLAQLLEKFLKKYEIPLMEVHIIGHSLGAHIAGNMGRYFNDTVGRITGLDPALPLFTADANDSLHSNNALFVDVIHTGYPVFGDNSARGTIDFYPNYGYIPQKGCDDVNLITISKLLFQTHSCSHNRAVILYAESIGLPQNFPAIPCSMTGITRRSQEFCLRDLENIAITKSSLADAIQFKSEEGIAYMGEAVSRSASGLYYLETYETPPYGLGLFTLVY